MRLQVGLWLLLLLLCGCGGQVASTPPLWYVPQKMLPKAVDGVEPFAGDDGPEVLLDHLNKVAGAYLDLLSVAQVYSLQGDLPTPAQTLGQSGGQVRVVGPVHFDWVVVIHQKDLEPVQVREALRQGRFHLLGQPGPGLTLYLPTANELLLVRILEQWRSWGLAEVRPHWNEEALSHLQIESTGEGVAQAEVSLLMRSQWEALHRDGSANVLAYDHLLPLQIEGPLVVAPWGLVTMLPAPAGSQLARLLPTSPKPPAGARLSGVTRARARLAAHTLFPGRFGRRSQVTNPWFP